LQTEILANNGHFHLAGLGDVQVSYDSTTHYRTVSNLGGINTSFKAPDEITVNEFTSVIDRQTKLRMMAATWRKMR
jgi:hypothetical protein